MKSSSTSLTQSNPAQLLICAVIFLLSALSYSNQAPAAELFPPTAPINTWTQFKADGYSKSACGVVYDFAHPATNGMPIGGMDTGCIDLETSGLWGYCTIFNTHSPRRGPLNLPFLGLSVDDQVWVLCDPSQMKQYERGAIHDVVRERPGPLEPPLEELDFYEYEIQDSYGHFVLETPGLLAYYRLDEGASATTLNNIAPTGGAAGTYPEKLTRGVPGAIVHDTNPAICFNEPGQVIQVKDIEPLNETHDALTVEFWLNPHQVAAHAMVLGRDSLSDGQRHWKAGIRAATVEGQTKNVVFYEFFGEGRGGNRGASGAEGVVEVGQWTHVVITYGDGKRQLWVQGKLVDESQVEGPVPIGDGMFSIGGRGDGGESYRGGVDEVALYNRILTPDEIHEHYDIGSTQGKPLCSYVQTAQDIHYWGHYPVADLQFDSSAPVQVRLRSWSPFIPGDTAASMTPGAVFEVHLHNTSHRTQQGKIVFDFFGPLRREAGFGPVSRTDTSGKLTGTHVAGEWSSFVLGAVNEPAAETGGSLGADGQAWAAVPEGLPEAASDDLGSSVAVPFALAAGESKVVRYVLAWHSPQWLGAGYLSAKSDDFFTKWVPVVSDYDDEAQNYLKQAPVGNRFTHMYARHYSSALATAEHLASNHKTLLRRILSWQQAIYGDEALPVWLRESLVNNFYLLAEDALWAQADDPLPDWVRNEDGLFGLIEDPRSCPQIECIPCSFYGNWPLVWFFPETALSTLRGYKGYMFPDGAVPWCFGGITCGTPAIDFAMPTRGYQIVLNGSCYTDMVSRYWLRTRDQKFLEEFFPSVKKSIEYMVNLRPEYSIGDRIISMPTGNAGTQWFEAPDPDWAGMVTHIGGIHLAQLGQAQRMAAAAGDAKFAQQCRDWIAAGSASLEENMWRGEYYGNFLEPETGKRNDLVFGYQLDGEWMARLHGLPGVFRADRLSTTLATIQRCNARVSETGIANYCNPDGTPAQVGGYGTYGYFPPELLMLSMLYMYDAEENREFALEKSRQCWENMVLKWRYTWNLINMVRGDQDTGERQIGFDYYQDMMLWVLPIVMEGENLDTYFNKRENLIERVLEAGRPAW